MGSSIFTPTKLYQLNYALIKKKPSSIKDIARKANVSVGTVDRVIHNRGQVSEETYKKVKALLKELDYRPNLIARSLSQRKETKLAILLPIIDDPSRYWYYPGKGIEKAERELLDFNVDITYFNFDLKDERSFIEQSEEILKFMPDCVLTAPVFKKETLDFLDTCKGRNIACHIIDTELEERSELDFIGQDANKSGYLAAKLLKYGLPKEENGTILVATILYQNEGMLNVEKKVDGFKQFFKDHQSNIRIEDTIFTSTNDQDLFLQLDYTFKKVKDIKAIYVTNSRGYKIATYLNKHNLTGMRFVGYDLLPENIHFLNKGTIDFLINQKPEEQGYQGVMSMFDKTIKKDNTQDSSMPIEIITKENYL